MFTASTQLKYQCVGLSMQMYSSSTTTEHCSDLRIICQSRECQYKQRMKASTVEHHFNFRITCQLECKTKRMKCKHTFQRGLSTHGEDASTVDQHIDTLVPLQQGCCKRVYALGAHHVDGQNIHFWGTSFLAGLCYLHQNKTSEEW